MKEFLERHLCRYLKGLFVLAHDTDGEIRKEVCSGMIRLMVNRPDMLRPFMQDIIRYMLQSTQDSDENVALESCEFWTAFVEAQIEPDVLRPFLPQLLPILLKNMVHNPMLISHLYKAEVVENSLICLCEVNVLSCMRYWDSCVFLCGHYAQIYSDDDDAVVEAREAENDIEETAKDIRPFHAGRQDPSEDAVEPNGSIDDDDDNNGAWTLRKCSAAGLDLLSEVFGDDLLGVLRPIVWQRLQVGHSPHHLCSIFL